MPVGACFSLLGKAKDVVVFIMERLEKLEMSDNIVKRIQENLNYLKLTIEKIEPYLQKDSDIEEITKFLKHLENANKSCEDIAQKHKAMKFIQVPAIIENLNHIERELQSAKSRLYLFITSSHLIMDCDTASFQNAKLTKISVLVENEMAGLNIVTNKAVKPPPPPLGFTIQESQNTFILSWQPSKGNVTTYEICYNEQENATIRVENVNYVTICSPRVLPGKLYIMKVRGINEGGNGDWSEKKAVEFINPLPQKPEISNMFFRSTMVNVTIKIPDKIRKTESAVTHVAVHYVNVDTSDTLSVRTFKVNTSEEKPLDNHTFTVCELQPNMKYNFFVTTMNAEGWSESSDDLDGYTLELPPKPSKPQLPFIKAVTSSKIRLIAEMPENTCGETSPIVAWSLSGYTADIVKVEKYYELDETDFMDDFTTLPVADLDPNQQYTLQLLAKNENGWSEPSEEFTVHIAKPSTPTDVRVSSLRSHSIIKIRWTAPDSSLISHYEILKRKRKGQYPEAPIIVPAKKHSVTFKNLSQNTYYYFKICTTYGDHTSEWSEEVKANTRIHKGIKAALSPIVWVLGSVTAPLSLGIAGAIGGGRVAGRAANETGGKVARVAARTAGSIGGAVVGTLGGIVAGNLTGAVYAHYFVHGIDVLSDQSDDEDAVIIDR